MRVVLTSSEGSFEGLEGAIAGLGVELRRIPLLGFEPPERWDEVDAALAGIAAWRAVAITSPRAAKAVAERLPVRTASVPLWTTGAATAEPLLGRFVTIWALPDAVVGGRAEALADAMLAGEVESPVLFPCGSLRREALVERLAASGVRVDPVLCYRSVPATATLARAAIHDADVVVAASPSVVRLLLETPAPRPLLLAAGATTAGAARELGWPPDAVAHAMTGASLGTSLTELLSR